MGAYSECISLLTEVKRRFEESEDSPNMDGIALPKVQQACQAAEAARNALLEASGEIDLIGNCTTCANANCPRNQQPCADCCINFEGEEGVAEYDEWQWRWPCHSLTGDTFAEVAAKAIEVIKSLEEAEGVLHGYCGACAHHNCDGGEQPCKSCSCRQLHKGLIDNWEWRWPLQKFITPSDLQMRLSVGNLLPCAIQMARELNEAKAALHGECAACTCALDEGADDLESPPECEDCTDGCNWRGR